MILRLAVLPAFVAYGHRESEENQAIILDGRGYFARVKHKAESAAEAAAQTFSQAAVAVAQRVSDETVAQASEADSTAAQLNGTSSDAADMSIADLELYFEKEAASNNTVAHANNPAASKLLKALGENANLIGDLTQGKCPEFKKDGNCYGCKLGCDCGGIFQRCYEGDNTCGVMQMAQTSMGTIVPDCLDATLGRCKTAWLLIAGITLGVILVLTMLSCACAMVSRSSDASSDRPGGGRMT